MAAHFVQDQRPRLACFYSWDGARVGEGRCVSQLGHDMEHKCFTEIPESLRRVSYDVNRVLTLPLSFTFLRPLPEARGSLLDCNGYNGSTAYGKPTAVALKSNVCKLQFYLRQGCLVRWAYPPPLTRAI